ncbi:MAG: hypothetical protein ACOZQL_38285 [Myxococcota bacterium]
MTRRAGIIELVIDGKGPKRGFVFDPHRLALPCWAEVGPALLVTFDRHFDTVPPVNPPPPGLTDFDGYARAQLDHRNFDHVLAAMDAGVITDAIVVARARPVGAVTADWKGHQVVHAPTLDVLTAEWGTPRASPEGKRAHQLLAEAPRVILDVDLDCFTTPSDADPTTVVPWSRELIREFLRPRDSAGFWELVLGRCAALTFAREPSHCGGLIAAGRLFEHACEVLFGELFETDLP